MITLINSEIESISEYKDGKQIVVEAHTDSDGEVHRFEYVATPHTDISKKMTKNRTYLLERLQEI